MEFLGSLAPIGTCRPQLRPAARPGWWHVAGPEGASDAVRRYPGATDTLSKDGAMWVPANLVAALSERFELLESVKLPVPHGEVYSGLRSYQRECVDFATLRLHRGIYLGLDLGLGKTLAATSIAVAEQYDRVLVTGPLIARGAWCGSASDPRKYYGIEVTALQGRKDLSVRAQQLFAKPGWFFCHYDILEAWMPWFLHFFRPQCLIFDELDVCRGYKSRSSRAARALGRLASVERRIGLSGTPVHNTVMDLWPQLDAIEPYGFGGRMAFGVRYASGESGQYGMIYAEPSYVHELQARLAGIYVYKSRRDVIAELPPVTRQRVEATLDEETMRAYADAERDIRQYVTSLGRGMAPGSPEALARVTALMKLIGNAKVGTTIAVAKNALKQGSKVVVFTWFRETARKIAKALKKNALQAVDGSVCASRRLELAAEFAERNDPTAFVATIGAAGTSLNGLQASSVVILSELWWTPARLLQAEGRVWRLGTPHGVSALYVCAEGTIDEELLQMLLTKADAIGQTSGNVDAGMLVQSLAERETDDLDGFVSALEKRITEWRSGQ